MGDDSDGVLGFQARTPYRIVGVSLIGPPPIGTVHLEWRPGLTVLYGLNGAGKSAILRGLVDVLRGSKPGKGTGVLHVEVADPQDEIEWVEGTYPTLFAESTGEHASEVAKHEVLGHRSPTVEYSWDAPTFAAEIRQILDVVLVRDQPDFGPMADEIAPQGLISLTAIGGREPGYRMFASARPSEDTPALNRVLAKITARIAAERERRGSIRSSRPRPVGPVGWDPHIAEALLREAQPTWVPVPLVQIGTFPHTVADVFVGDEGDADRETHDLLNHLSNQSPSFLGTQAPTASPLSDEDSLTLSGVALELSHRTSELAAELLQDAPLLTLEPYPITEWVKGRYARWEALDPPSRTVVPLKSLSQAQARWASVAIELSASALRTDLTPLTTGYEEFEDWPEPSALVIDEPEQALHGRAIDRLLDALATIARRGQSPVFVASHAAASLDVGRAHLIHVDRSSGAVRLNDLPNPLVETLGTAAEQLGVRTSDLLQLTSVFLLVEGAADEAVLQETLGDELARLRTRIVPMRGSKGLSGAIDSQFIFDYTSASVVVCLDRVRTGRINRVIGDAHALFEEGKIKPALHRLDRAAEHESATSEETEAYRFARRALETRHHDRITIFGLRQPDIIYYLPVSSFHPHATEWQEVQEGYKTSRKPRENMKSWLRRSYQARTAVNDLRKAARRLDHLPTEFTDLLETVEAAAGRRRA